MSLEPHRSSLLSAALLAFTVHCGPSENASRKSLEEDGYADIVLTRDGDGFSFTAKKGKQSCKGTVRASGNSSSLTSFCVDAEPARVEPVCAEGAADVCFDHALVKDKTGDHAGALVLYEKGCGFGDAASCSNAGVGYDHGEGAAIDRVKAVEFFEKGCKGKHAMGCSNLGKALRRQGKAEPALAAFEQSCGLEFAEGCYLVGIMHENPPANGKKDYAAAHVAFGKGCSAREPSQNACGALGVANVLGEGIPKDPKKGEEMLQSACDKGSAEACKNLGVLIRDGKLGARDPKRSAALFEKACPEDANACSEAALAYERGTGVTKDPAKALSFYEKACAEGSTVGCTNYGISLRDGMGLPAKDPKKAREAFGKACKAGDQRACGMEKALPP